MSLLDNFIDYLGTYYLQVFMLLLRFLLFKWKMGPFVHTGLVDGFYFWFFYFIFLSFSQHSFYLVELVSQAIHSDWF